jgi:hypothetical protein
MGAGHYLDSAPEEAPPMIQAQKDNIYTGQYFYDGKPQGIE